VIDDLDWRTFKRFQFGSSPEMAQRLAALVIAGRKTATVSAVASNPNGESTIGERWVVEAGPDWPVAVIETVMYEKRRFDEIDPDFAAAEGERDLSYAWWRHDHETYFKAEGTYAPDMHLWAERFRLIAVLDEVFAATAADHVAAEIASAAGDPPK
jgi:uncharacterized protein YhfF